MPDYCRRSNRASPFRIRAAQEFYLKSSEALTVLVERRGVGEQVPKHLVEGISRQISELL